MKSKIILGLTLGLSGLLSGGATIDPRADKMAGNAAVSPKAEEIIRRVADYYQNLKSFEGTNTISDQMPAFKAPLVARKQFAFLRPNQFLLYSESTNDSRLFCDGTNLCDYRPYYFNSYTVTPAPARFEDAITNWVGGELLHLIIKPDRYHYVMSGFSWGMVALKYVGEEVVTGVNCYHLSLEEDGSKFSELWVAKGRSPFILKYAFRYPVPESTNQPGEHTEVISGWKANRRIPIERFIFVPPTGAIEQPAGADQVEMSTDSKTGVTKVRFYAKDDLKDDSARLQALALESILAKYPALTTNDLVFTGIQHFRPATGQETIVASYQLPKTAETREVNNYTQTKTQTIDVTLSPAGVTKSVIRGVSISIRSPGEKK